MTTLTPNRFSRFRREYFGGLVMNPDREVFFVKNPVIDALESRMGDEETIGFLTQIGALSQGQELISCEPDRFLVNEIDVSNDRPPLSGPLVVSLFITNKCNLSCPHCALGSGPNVDNANDLRTDELLSLFDELHALKVFGVAISGGEPMLRADIFELVAYLNDLGMAITLLTNGQLLDVEAVQRMPREVAFQLSLDFLHGRRCQEQVVELAKWLKQDGRSVTIATMFVRGHTDQALEVFEQLNLQDDIPVIVTPIMPFGHALDHKDLLLTRDEVEQFVAIKGAKKKYYQEQGSVNRRDPIRDRGFQIAHLNEVFESINWACSGYRIESVIAPDGAVFPCINALCCGDYCAGSIRTQTLREIWEKSEVVNSFRKIYWDGFSECRNCDISDYCNFHCPVVSKVLHGNEMTCGADEFTRTTLSRAIQLKMTSQMSPDQQ